MTPEILRTHLAYKRWQTTRLVDAVRPLPPEVYETARGSSHGGIKGTLEHIYGADFVWMRRLQGLSLTRADVSIPERFDELEKAWMALIAEWQQWAAAVPDQGWDEKLNYTLFNGTQCSTPLWQIVMHVVNHGTLHGGQVVAMLRQAGITPPQTDLLLLYRELDAQRS